MVSIGMLFMVCIMLHHGLLGLMYIHPHGMAMLGLLDLMVLVVLTIRVIVSHTLMMQLLGLDWVILLSQIGYMALRLILPIPV